MLSREEPTMIIYRIATKEDLELLLDIRIEMLKIVNNLPLEYQFDKELLVQSEKYFMNGNQTTVLALDGDVIGCATICYTDVIPNYHYFVMFQLVPFHIQWEN